MMRGKGNDAMIRVKNRLPLLIVWMLAAAALLFSVFGEVGILNTWRMGRNQRQLVEENARLREDNARLRAEVDKLRTNPAYIEEIARKELGLIGSKENVIVLERKLDDRPGNPPPGGTTRR